MILLVYFVASVRCTLQYDLLHDKRDTTGVLDIVNDDRAIHTDIKPDADKLSLQDKLVTGALDIVDNDRAIHTDIRLDNDKVTAPKIVFDTKSLRKSYPLAHTIDIVRGVNRVASLATLIIVAMLELYPIVCSLYNYVYEYFVGQ